MYYLILVNRLKVKITEVIDRSIATIVKAKKIVAINDTYNYVVLQHYNMKEGIFFYRVRPIRNLNQKFVASDIRSLNHDHSVCYNSYSKDLIMYPAYWTMSRSL